MHQLLLVVGIVLASSMGLALLALVLKSSLRNSRTSRFDNVQTLPLIEEPVLAENTDLAHAVRGYDTPELYRQDELSRAQFQSRKSPDDSM